MNKKWLLFLLILMIVFPDVCLANSSKAYYTDIQTGELMPYPAADVEYLVKSDGTAVIYSVSLPHSTEKELNGTLYLPSQVDKYTVTSFDDYLFEEMDLSSFSKVIFPETVSLFEQDDVYCTHGVLINGNISEVAFAGENPVCQVKDNCSILENGRLVGLVADTNKTEYAVPEGAEVLDIGLICSAFPNLTTLVLPSTLTQIVCLDCLYTSALRTIKVHEDNPVFHSADGVLFMGDTLFLYPPDRRDIDYEVPEGVTSVSSFAFCYNDNLINVVLPKSMHKLSANAFIACRSLHSINIPSGLEEIDEGAFAYCWSLDSINLSPDNGNFSLTNGMLIDNARDMLLVAFSNGETHLSVPGSIRFIGAYAFTNHGYISEAVLLRGVERIGENAFSLSYLTEIHLPDSLKTIEHGAFYACSELKTVTFDLSGSELKSIGEDAFSDCASLTEIILPDGLEEIDDFAFFNCESLKKIHIPDSVTYIGSLCFSYSSSLQILKLPESLAYVDYSYYASDTNLEFLIIPKNADLSGMHTDDMYVPNSYGCYRLAVYSGSNAHEVCEQKDIPYTLTEELPFILGDLKVVSTSDSDLQSFIDGGGTMICQYKNGEMKIILQAASGEKISGVYPCGLENGRLVLEGLGNLTYKFEDINHVQLISDRWTMELEGVDLT